MALWPSLQKTLSAGWGWILDAVLSSVRSRLKTKSGNLRSMECNWPLVTATSDLTAKGQAPWEGLMYTAWWVNLIEGRWGLGYRAPPPQEQPLSKCTLLERAQILAAEGLGGNADRVGRTSETFEHGLSFINTFDLLVGGALEPQIV